MLVQASQRGTDVALGQARDPIWIAHGAEQLAIVRRRSQDQNFGRTLLEPVEVAFESGMPDDVPRLDEVPPGVARLDVASGQDQAV